MEFSDNGDFSNFQGIWYPFIQSPDMWSPDIGCPTFDPHSEISEICSWNIPFLLTQSWIFSAQCVIPCALLNSSFFSLSCMSPVHELSYQAGSVFLHEPTIWKFYYIACAIFSSESSKNLQQYFWKSGWVPHSNIQNLQIHSRYTVSPWRKLLLKLRSTTVKL